MNAFIRKKCRDFISNLFYHFFILTHNYNVMNFDDTIDVIYKKHLSASRFGDGEFKWLLNVKQKSFQQFDLTLSERLEEVLLSDNSKCLICIPHYFTNDNGLSVSAKKFSYNFIRCYGKKVSRKLSQKRIYGDSYFTRCYRSRKNVEGDLNIKKTFNRIKKIWDSRDVIVVEGELTRFGVGNDLLDNAKSIKRIIAPSKNAFSFYGSILKSVKDNYSDELILVSLGPTATVLAYDLSKEDIQTIDIGHLDIEYEWYLRGSHNEKILIPGKYVNEAGGFESEMNDAEALKKYEDQIIVRICTNE